MVNSTLIQFKNNHRDFFMKDLIIHHSRFYNSSILFDVNV